MTCAYILMRPGGRKGGGARRAQAPPKEMHFQHISTEMSKPLPVTFGQTEKYGIKVFSSFQLGLPSKVPQTP